VKSNSKRMELYRLEHQKTPTRLAALLGSLHAMLVWRVVLLAAMDPLAGAERLQWNSLWRASWLIDDSFGGCGTLLAAYLGAGLLSTVFEQHLFQDQHNVLHGWFSSCRWLEEHALIRGDPPLCRQGLAPDLGSAVHAWL